MRHSPRFQVASSARRSVGLLYRQIGLGGNVTLDTITVPTEVVLWRGTPSGTRTRCIDLNVGGDLAFFTVERVDGTAIRNVEVLSCGNGQYGGLGNALFSNAQSVPVRTKAVSGLLECTSLFIVLPLEQRFTPPCHMTFGPPSSLGKDK